MMSPICGEEVTARELNRELNQFIKVLMSKVEENNPKVRQTTQQTLLGVYRNNSKADESRLIDVIMEIVNKGGAFSPNKAAERIILGRLELLSMLLKS